MAGWKQKPSASTFQNFVRNIHPERPAVLFCDGHTSHIGVGLTENAKKENVVISKLSPHTSHVLQPMDLSVFRPLKLMWDEEIIKWQRRNYARKLPKSTFSSIMSKIWKNISPNIIQSKKPEYSSFVTVLFWRSRMNQKPVEDGQVSRKAKKLQHCRQHLIKEELHSCRQKFHAEGAATSFLLRFHADEIVSYPSARIIPISQNKTFEELLLDQVKQMPHVRTGRKRICGRA